MQSDLLVEAVFVSRQEPGFGTRPVYDAVIRQPLFEPSKAEVTVIVDIENDIDLTDEISFQRLPILNHTAVELDVDRNSCSLHASDCGPVATAEQREGQFDGERRQERRQRVYVRHAIGQDRGALGVGTVRLAQDQVAHLLLLAGIDMGKAADRQSPQQTVAARKRDSIRSPRGAQRKGRSRSWARASPTRGSRKAPPPPRRRPGPNSARCRKAPRDV